MSHPKTGRNLTKHFENNMFLFFFADGLHQKVLRQLVPFGGFLSILQRAGRKLSLLSRPVLPCPRVRNMLKKSCADAQESPVQLTVHVPCQGRGSQQFICTAICRPSTHAEVLHDEHPCDELQHTRESFTQSTDHRGRNHHEKRRFHDLLLLHTWMMHAMQESRGHPIQLVGVDSVTNSARQRYSASPTSGPPSAHGCTPCQLCPDEDQVAKSPRS